MLAEELPMTYDEWREWRRSHIGASEAAAVLGVSEWESPRDIYYHKVYPATDLPRKKTQMGHRLQDVALDLAEDVLGQEIYRGTPFADRPERRVGICQDIGGSVLAATLDGMTPDGASVEAKASGIEGPVWGEWGEPMTDAVPLSVIVQCQVQSMATGKPTYVSALLGGRGHVMYVVQPSADLAAEIREKVDDFWDRYVGTLTPPPEQGVRLETLAAIQRHAEVVDLEPQHDPLCDDLLGQARQMLGDVPETADVIHAYAKIRALASSLETMQTVLKARVIELLGDADEARAPHDDPALLWKLTYKPVSRKKCLYDRLAAKYADAFAECVEQTTSPTFNLRAVKK